MPKQKEMKYWQIMKEAQKYLSNKHGSDSPGKVDFICYAIAKVIDPGWSYFSFSTCDDHPIFKRIQNSLENSYTLERWLVCRGFTTWDYLQSSQGRSQIQLYRKRWMKELQREFKAQNL